MSAKPSDAQRLSAPAAPLAALYRAIGPAAIAAALVCKPKAQAPAQPKRR